MRLDECARVAWWQVGCVCKRKISFVNRLVFSSKVDNGCHNVRHIAQNVENVNVYFFLRTNYSNYVTFDEALALLYWLKKRQ